MVFRKIDINSGLLAMFLSTTCLASIMDAIISIPYASVFMALIIAVVLIAVNYRSFLFTRSSIIAYLCVLSVLLISLVLNNWNTFGVRYTLFFIVFGTTALLLTGVKVNYKTAFLIWVCISILYLIQELFLPGIDALKQSDMGVEQMGLAYSFVPSALLGGSFLVSSKLRRSCKVSYIIIGVVLLIGASYIILFRTVTRGAILSVLLGFFLLSWVVSGKQRRNWIISILLCVGLLVYLNIDSILDGFIAMFQNSEIGALKKMVSFMGSDNVSNGRDLLYANAITYIKERPILGHGVGYFESHNGIYVHQLLLQLM